MMLTHCIKLENLESYADSSLVLIDLREVWRGRTGREGSDGGAKITDVKGEAFSDRY